MSFNTIVPGQLRTVLSTYAERVRAFQPNARLYLVNAVILGAAQGVYRLLFNFYVLSLGYDQALLGNLITISSLTALIAAVPMGYLADKIGRKTSLIVGSWAFCLAVALMIVRPVMSMFIAMNVFIGLSQSLVGVTMGPFLMENSGEKERTYLFSFASGLQTGSGFVGNWIGGYLPGWLGAVRQVAATSAQAYGASLVLIVLVAIVGVVPLFFMRMPRLSEIQQANFAPISYLFKHFNQIGKLILPLLVTSVGAGLVIPFLNVFFRQVHHKTDASIGTLFAFGLLAMGVGMIIAPPLADRFGKIQVVVVTQGLSIPFLALLGFCPWFARRPRLILCVWRLMNMSGPVYQTFVMEHVR